MLTNNYQLCYKTWKNEFQQEMFKYYVEEHCFYDDSIIAEYADENLRWFLNTYKTGWMEYTPYIAMLECLKYDWDIKQWLYKGIEPSNLEI